MSNKNYHHKKIREGARLIADNIKETASRYHVDLIGIEWDGGRLEVSREDYHMLTVRSNEKTVKKSFYDEELTDFPYDSADTFEKIENMVDQLDNH